MPCFSLIRSISLDICDHNWANLPAEILTAFNPRDEIVEVAVPQVVAVNEIREAGGIEAQVMIDWRRPDGIEPPGHRRPMRSPVVDLSPVHARNPHGNLSANSSVKSNEGLQFLERSNCDHQSYDGNHLSWLPSNLFEST
jgi:hypothetical protein